MLRLSSGSFTRRSAARTTSSSSGDAKDVGVSVAGAGAALLSGAAAGRSVIGTPCSVPKAHHARCGGQARLHREGYAAFFFFVVVFDDATTVCFDFFLLAAA